MGLKARVCYKTRERTYKTDCFTGVTRGYSRPLLHYIKCSVSFNEIIFSLLPNLQFEMLTSSSYSLCICSRTTNSVLLWLFYSYWYQTGQNRIPSVPFKLFSLTQLTHHFYMSCSCRSSLKVLFF